MSPLDEEVRAIRVCQAPDLAKRSVLGADHEGIRRDRAQVDEHPLLLEHLDLLPPRTGPLGEVDQMRAIDRGEVVDPQSGVSPAPRRDPGEEAEELRRLCRPVVPPIRLRRSVDRGSGEEVIRMGVGPVDPSLCGERQEQVALVRLREAPEQVAVHDLERRNVRQLARSKLECGLTPQSRERRRRQADDGVFRLREVIDRPDPGGSERLPLFRPDPVDQQQIALGGDRRPARRADAAGVAPPSRPHAIGVPSGRRARRRAARGEPARS